ncbi:MAG: extracellular solute-binding protein [Acholeplasmataceae bacterium]|nr:extracellular solute-binding protein [Acholeplasmataceae bacterium]
MSGKRMPHNLSLYLILISLILLCVIVSGCVTSSTVNDDKKIVIWGYDSSADIAEKAVEIYKEEHPDSIYDFEVVKLGQDDMVEKFKIYLATGSLDSLPDIVYDEDYNFLEYMTYYGEYFVDLTPFIESDDYPQFKIINVNYDGKIYALPYDCGTGVLFYRIDLIEQAGYGEEDMANLTWEEYIEIGKKVKEVTGVDMLTIIPEGDMEGRLLYQSAGTWFFDQDGNANIKDNKAFEDAINTLKSAFDAGIVYKANSWDDMIAAISNQKIASLVGGSWWASIISSYDSQSGLWRIAEMPRMTGSDNYSSYSNLGGGNWFVLNKSNKDFAAMFAVEMFGDNKEVANFAALNTYIIPTNKNMMNYLIEIDNGSSFFGGQKVVTFMCSTVPKIKPVKYGLHTYEITYTIGENAGDYINGKMTLEETLTQMQLATEKVVTSN